MDIFFPFPSDGKINETIICTRMQMYFMHFKRCYFRGWSFQPVKNLLAIIQKWYHNQKLSSLNACTSNNLLEAKDKRQWEYTLHTQPEICVGEWMYRFIKKFLCSTTIKSEVGDWWVLSVILQNNSTLTEQLLSEHNN